MNAKQINRSHRLLYIDGDLSLLLYGTNELNCQMAEDKQENLAKLFGIVEECPCGCGLKNAVCNTQYEKVKVANDEIPF